MSVKIISYKLSWYVSGVVFIITYVDKICMYVLPCVCPSKVLTLQNPFNQFLRILNLSVNIAFHW